MPGRMPMNASISSGLRRTSLVRSAALRSGLATIAAMRSRVSVVDWQPATIAATSPRKSRRILSTAFYKLDRRLEERQVLLVLGRVGVIDLHPFARRRGAQAAGLEGLHV